MASLDLRDCIDRRGRVRRKRLADFATLCRRETGRQSQYVLLQLLRESPAARRVRSGNLCKQLQSIARAPPAHDSENATALAP